MKPIKKYRKNQSDKNDPSRGANSDDTQGVTDTANSVVGQQGSSEPNTVNQKDGWICKICHMSGNQQKQCEMCKQERKDSHDEENIKNRRKRKNMNRSKLHAGQSIRVDKERNRQKLIAEDIANNIRDYCQKVVQCKIYISVAGTFIMLTSNYKLYVSVCYSDLWMMNINFQ